MLVVLLPPPRPLLLQVRNVAVVDGDDEVFSDSCLRALLLVPLPLPTVKKPLLSFLLNELDQMMDPRSPWVVSVGCSRVAGLSRIHCAPSPGAFAFVRTPVGRAPRLSAQALCEESETKSPLSCCAQALTRQPRKRSCWQQVSHCFQDPVAHYLHLQAWRFFVCHLARLPWYVSVCASLIWTDKIRDESLSVFLLGQPKERESTSPF